MKVLIFLSALVGFCSSSYIVIDESAELVPVVESTDLVEWQPIFSVRTTAQDMLTDILEKGRDEMEYGSPDLGIPPLDPYTMDKISFDIYEGFLVKLKVVLTDIVLKGFKDFIVQRLNLKIMQFSLDYDFLVPELNYTSKFTLHAKIAGILNIQRSGKLEISMSDFVARGSVKYDVTKSGNLRLKKFILKFDAKHVNAFMEGFFIFGKTTKLANLLLQYLSNDFFQVQRKRLNDWVNKYVGSMIQEGLSKLKLEDLMSA